MDDMDKHYVEFPVCVLLFTSVHLLHLYDFITPLLITYYTCMISSHPYGNTHVHLPLPPHTTLSSHSVVNSMCLAIHKVGVWCKYTSAISEHLSSVGTDMC